MRPAALFLLAGCPTVGPGEWRSVEDVDDDGSVSVRFGGEDCRDEDPSIKDCDKDGDTFLDVAAGGDDCNDGDPDVNPDTVWLPDDDGDLFGDAEAVGVTVCVAPEDHVRDATDCDDGDGGVNPDADETCDDVDRDCSGDPFDVPRPPAYFVDDDGDGYGASGAAGSACVPPAGHTSRPGDCDDNDPDETPNGLEVAYDGHDNDCVGGDLVDHDGDGSTAAEVGGPDCADRDPARNPAAAEVCNGLDDDCDGTVDEGTWTPADGGVGYFPDDDHDGYGDATAAPTYTCTGPPVGFLTDHTDCDDAEVAVSPVAGEVCNNRDDDCDGLADEDPDDGGIFYEDHDGDGFGFGAPIRACGVGNGTAATGADCLDSDPDVYPGAPEVCGDAIRQDCDDTLSPDDCDGDSVDAPEDCLDDPSHPLAVVVHPGATEECNGVDDDCDGLTDGEQVTDPQLWPDWYVDLDGDGYGGPTLASTQTCSPPTRSAPNATDCDDARAGVHPNATETCNGLDDDCMGGVDDVAPADATAWYTDGDGDGYGRGAPLLQCAAPVGRVDVPGDCDDGDPDVSPLGDEVCNTIDDDCDGRVDQADDDLAERVYQDGDGDGVGTDTNRAWCGAPPVGWAGGPGDCDDTDDAVFPDADEVCNGADDDCDLAVDDADGSLTDATDLFADLDLDGYGDPLTGVTACAEGPGRTADDSDCDDADPSIHPDALDRCGEDADCDGVMGPNPLGRVQRFTDADGDGFGDDTNTVLVCLDEAGATDLGGDCDDAVGDVFPGAMEICNGRDDDCDSRVDDILLAQAPQNGAVRWYPDADGDGFTPDAPGTVRCSPGPGEVAAPTTLVDCDDSSPFRSPVLVEVCDLVDNDCDGPADEGAVGGPLRYLDADNDGLGRDSAEAVCANEVGYVDVAGDCDDQDFDVRGPTWLCSDGDGDGWGSASDCSERCLGVDDDSDCDDGDDQISPDGYDADCDGVDENCDGTPDELSIEAGYEDLDGDGYGSSVAKTSCSGVEWALVDGDCDDVDPAVSPGVFEICGNGIDEDCDGFDPGCGVGTGSTGWWVDADNDGFGDPTTVPVLSDTPVAGRADNPVDCNDNDALNATAFWPTVVSNNAELSNAINSATTCLIVDVDAVFTITTPVTLSGTKRRHFRRQAAAGAAGMVGNMAGINLSGAGTVVLHEVDLARTGMGATMIYSPPSFAAYVLVSHADIDGSIAPWSGFVYASDGLVRTVRTTVHDFAGFSAPLFAGGADQEHYGLDLDNVVPVMDGTPENLLLHDVSVTAPVSLFGYYAAGRGQTVHGVVRFSDFDGLGIELDTNMRDWSVEDCTFTNNAVLDVSGKGANDHYTIVRSSFTAGATLHASSISNVFVDIDECEFEGADLTFTGMLTTPTITDSTFADSAFAISGSYVEMSVASSDFVNTTLGSVSSPYSLELLVTNSTFDGGGIVFTGLATYQIDLVDDTFTGAGFAVPAASMGGSVQISDTTFDDAPSDAIAVTGLGGGGGTYLEVLDTTIRSPGSDGIQAGSTSVTGLVQRVAVLDPGDAGVVGGQYLDVGQVTVVSAGTFGVDQAGGAGTVRVQDSIVVDSVTFDLGSGVTPVNRAMFGSKAGGVPGTSVLGVPGFVRYSGTADAWDVHLHPLATCTGAENQSGVSSFIGAFPQVSAADGDGDTMSDAWEVAWFGSPAAGLGSGDPDADLITNDDEYATCGDP